MTKIIDISPEKAWELVERGAILLDIRAEKDFNQKHIPETFNLTEKTYQLFDDSCDYDDPIIIMCYHGISSKSVATRLVEEGYEQIYNLIGGFEAWEKQKLPIENSKI